MSRRLVEPGNSQLRSVLKEIPESAEWIRATGWAIAVAGAFALMPLWLPIPYAVPGVILAGAGVGLLGSGYWTRNNSQVREAAFQAMPAHLAALDAEGNVTIVNDAWKQFAIRNGFRGNGQGLGTNYVALCESATGECAEEAREVAAGVRRVLAGKQSTFSIEYPCHSPTEERWFRCLVSSFPGGGQGALVTHLDITEQVKTRAALQVERADAQTERQAAERRLRISRIETEDLRTALDEHAMVAIFDVERRILSVNDRYCQILGRKREDLVGAPAWLPENAERDRALEQGLVWKNEAALSKPDGGICWVNETIVPFHDESGQIHQFVSIGTDITSRKEAEAMLTEFASLASHDLREPLRGVAGCARLLEDRYGGQLEEKGREWLRHITSNANRMQEMVSGLLDLCHHRRGDSLEHPVDGRAVVAGALEALRESIAESGACVTVDAVPDLRGDGRQIGQVFQNLIANSIKFRRGDAVPEIRIAVREKEGFAEFAVRDNGMGIDPRHSARIFGMFVRLPGDRPGTGMGLAIAKQIVERHGGKIWVAAVPPGEAGAEIRFTLPLKNSEYLAMKAAG